MKNNRQISMEVAKGLTIVGLILFSLFTVWMSANGGDLIKVKDLAGQWKFTINEKDGWNSTRYDDKNWEIISVPSPWEDQGFYGYNGFGYYRKSFTVPSNLKGKSVYLMIGYIDDVDETYVNGQKIGSSGTFPPAFNTAYNALRLYAIPEGLLKYDIVNTIAVKVYDPYQAGGIVSGEVGLFTSRFDMSLEINLQGKWKFSSGDDLAHKDWKLDDSNWDEVFVPAKWEDQGYRDYDGYGWYRKSFKYNGVFTEEKAVLVLGKIDDVDQVFINGVFVGATGEFSDKAGRTVDTGERYRAFRGYYIPVNLLKKDQMNTIAVRVYDSGGDGGIYEGPVGLLSQADYIRYWRERKGLTND